MIGRLLLREYIKAAEMMNSTYLNRAKFILCGEFDKDYPDSISLDELTKDVDSGIIEYKGRIKDVITEIRNADCIVLPSYYNEGMNRFLMESISIGKPIITCDNRGCREFVIDNENGYIIDSQNPYALYKAMVKIINMSEDERAEFGMKSRALAEDIYDVKNVICSYDSILKLYYNI